MMFAADQGGKPYGEYAGDYRVLAECQLLTAERFGFDLVSTISDPAREAADCGAAVEYYENQPPAIDEANALLKDKATLAKLRVPDPLGGGRMHDRVNGVALLREKGGDDFVVEGWIEGPCAEAADLRGINLLMLDFFDDPAFVRDLFDFILEMELGFARAQIDAGADWLGIGDAAASLIGPRFYEEFVFPYEKRMVDAIHEMGAMARLHICGNTSPLVGRMGQLGCEIVDLDYMVSMAAAREAMGAEQILLGNIDPVSVLRNGTPDKIEDALEQCHRDAGSRYIASAGCEVPRDTPLENLEAMRQFARSRRP
jgi:MtaA/CmuA family methyltransferase